MTPLTAASTGGVMQIRAESDTSREVHSDDDVLIKTKQLMLEMQERAARIEQRQKHLEAQEKDIHDNNTVLKQQHEHMKKLSSDLANISQRPTTRRKQKDNFVAAASPHREPSKIIEEQITQLKDLHSQIERISSSLKSRLSLSSTKGNNRDCAQETEPKLYDSRRMSDVTDDYFARPVAPYAKPYKFASNSATNAQSSKVLSKLQRKDAGSVSRTAQLRQHLSKIRGSVASSDSS